MVLHLFTACLSDYCLMNEDVNHTPYARHELGREAENTAAAYLENKGYRIMARNYRANHCEIDIIVRENDVLAFIEVKASDSDIPPELMVDVRKTEHIFRAANAFLSQYKIEGLTIRFDIMAMRKDGEYWRINHIKDAFRP